MFAIKKQTYSWEKTFNNIKTKHDSAFKIIDEAITLEEREQPSAAIEKYKEGIKIIDEALSIQVQCPENPDNTWHKACSMIQKIKKTRAEVLTRINCIQQSSSFMSVNSVEDPPSYDVAMASSSEDETPITYVDLATALRELSVDPNHNLHEEIVYTHDNVRVYFISPNGEVLSTKEPETLKISLVEGDDPNTPKAILQVGDWIYPLVPGVSPCYRTNYGAFILPDLNASISGSSVGIILPSDADQELFDLLENILYGIISTTSAENIREWRENRTVPETEDYSTRISNRIVDGAFLLSRGIVRGAEKAGEYFNSKTPILLNKIQPSAEPANISPAVVSSMQVAESATNKAAKFTGFVAGKVSQATVKLGQFLAPHIQRGGTKVLVKGFNVPEEEASNKMKGVLTVAAGAVEGFATVYRGLETSASVLGNSLKENTVKIVEHKYGYPASTLTGDTLSTVGNVYNITRNAKIIKPKTFIRNAGVGLMHDYTSSARASTAYSAMEGTSNSRTNGEQNTETDTTKQNDIEKQPKKE